MRLRIVLPTVNPQSITVPSRCVYAGCSGRTLHLRLQEVKPLRDMVYHEVQVQR